MVKQQHTFTPQRFKKDRVRVRPGGVSPATPASDAPSSPRVLNPRQIQRRKQQAMRALSLDPHNVNDVEDFDDLVQPVTAVGKQGKMGTDLRAQLATLPPEDFSYELLEGIPQAVLTRANDLLLQGTFTGRVRNYLRIFKYFDGFRQVWCTYLQKRQQASGDAPTVAYEQGGPLLIIYMCFLVRIAYLESPHGSMTMTDLKNQFFTTEMGQGVTLHEYTKNEKVYDAFRFFFIFCQRFGVPLLPFNFGNILAPSRAQIVTWRQGIPEFCLAYYHLWHQKIYPEQNYQQGKYPAQIEEAVELVKRELPNVNPTRIVKTAMGPTHQQQQGGAVKQQQKQT